MGEKMQENEKVNKEDINHHTPKESNDKLESYEHNMETTGQEEESEGNAVPSNEQMLDFDDRKRDDIDLQGQQAVEQHINHTQDLTKDEDMQENVNSIS
ncbi:hypothetical protein HAX54_027744 [Datura stramonium]|uniref:Uncharacterized protein n=1 Tax=Datura stramonium TaxID=4076 RepID=A0ABS8V337_DATST|nr:hypothetical protein [Datura stramonium]